jgi:hypothetical protein
MAGRTISTMGRRAGAMVGDTGAKLGQHILAISGEIRRPGLERG